MFLPLMVAGGVLLVALGARTWWHVLVLGVGAAVAAVAFERWAAGGLLPVAAPLLALAAATWVVGGVVLHSGHAFYALSVAGPLAVPQLPRHRGAAAVVLIAVVGVVGAVAVATAPGAFIGDLITFLLVPTGITAVITGLMFPNKRFYDVVADLERARGQEAELAVARERVRFASDLHDIQGHTLHVVKLKVALAEKLLRADVDRAEQELREVRALVADTITQTKELAHAQRRLNLSAELENAKNLFEAAGITVAVTRGTEPDPRAGELLGQVLRETTTNVLRHAEATRVEVTLSATGITITNDGAPRTPLPPLRGLSTLRDRLAADGGTLSAALRDGRFTTAATLPTGPRRRPR
ncbi:sensor histidine kinase [Actinokineospora bangkokensis]|uniref:Sensor histidine kinase n=1 Tax=Actinokineospora bangkokensis TaxID=1193682 RepID=A0A1Q9LPE4_9PSEU|nr:histidine kinase [Actinokineospora bangkokensis]OLR93902.1 sensor histidine kinase [Actinokineospora bangkokensis]